MSSNKRGPVRRLLLVEDDENDRLLFPRAVNNPRNQYRITSSTKAEDALVL